MSTVAILDYECGNVRSIANAFIKIRANPVLTREPRVIQAADALVIPGVGAFANAMEALRHYGLIEQIYRFADSGKRILGICLGMQMLFEQSEEFGISRGLGLIPGEVKKLPVRVDESIRLPHIGWNMIYPSASGNWDDSILSDTQPGSKVYFVHSFSPVPQSLRHILSLTRYGDCEFVSAVRSGAVFGCQFHPEKSRETGLAILKQFVQTSEDVKNDRDIISRTERDSGLLRAAASGQVL
jgi:imidazole glycerol-phosphate synthase subunit HisH